LDPPPIPLARKMVSCSDRPVQRTHTRGLQRPLPAIRTRTMNADRPGGGMTQLLALRIHERKRKRRTEREREREPTKKTAKKAISKGGNSSTYPCRNRFPTLFGPQQIPITQPIPACRAKPTKRYTTPLSLNHPAPPHKFGNSTRWSTQQQ
jgi:hypothetical protein